MLIIGNVNPCPVEYNPGTVPAPLAEPVFYMLPVVLSSAPLYNPGEHCPETCPGADSLMRLSNVAAIQPPAALPLSTPPPVYLARNRPGNVPETVPAPPDIAGDVPVINPARKAYNRPRLRPARWKSGSGPGTVPARPMLFQLLPRPHCNGLSVVRPNISSAPGTGGNSRQPSGQSPGTGDGLTGGATGTDGACPALPRGRPRNRATVRGADPQPARGRACPLSPIHPIGNMIKKVATPGPSGPRNFCSETGFFFIMTEGPLGYSLPVLRRSAANLSVSKKQNLQKNRFPIQKTPVLRDFPGASFPGDRNPVSKKKKPRPAFPCTENQNQKENPRPAFPEKERSHNGDGPRGVVLPIMPTDRNGSVLRHRTGTVAYVEISRHESNITRRDVYIYLLTYQ